MEISKGHRIVSTYGARSTGKDLRSVCPKCSSPNIHKVSLRHRIAEAMLFGVADAEITRKIFNCNYCGHKW